jgi:hypothetical protein
MQMKRSTRFLSVSLTILSLGLALGSAAHSAPAPEKPLQVSNFGGKEPVSFDHGKHKGKGFECAMCHHDTAEGKYKCGECHQKQAAKGALSLKDAMHAKDKGVCYSCHVAADAKNKMKCADCHKK